MNTGAEHQDGTETSQQLKTQLPMLMPQVSASSSNATSRRNYNSRIVKIDELIQQMPPKLKFLTLRTNKYKSILRLLKRASAGENVDAQLERTERSLWKLHGGGRAFPQDPLDAVQLEVPVSTTPQFPQDAPSDYIRPRYSSGVQDELEELETGSWKTTAGYATFPEVAGRKHSQASRSSHVDEPFPTQPNISVLQYPETADSMETSSCDSSEGGAEFDFDDSSSCSSYGDVNSKDIISDIRSQVSLDDNISEASTKLDIFSLALVSNASLTEVQDAIADATNKWLLQDIVPDIGAGAGMKGRKIRRCALVDAITVVLGKAVEQMDFRNSETAVTDQVAVRDKLEPGTVVTMMELGTKSARPKIGTEGEIEAAKYSRAEILVEKGSSAASDNAPAGITKNSRTRLSLNEFKAVPDFLPARRVSSPTSPGPAVQPEAGCSRVNVPMAAMSLSKPQTVKIPKPQRFIDVRNAENVPTPAAPKANHLVVVHPWKSQMPVTDIGPPLLSQPVQPSGGCASIETSSCFMETRLSGSDQALGADSKGRICPKMVHKTNRRGDVVDYWETAVAEVRGGDAGAGSDSIEVWPWEPVQVSPAVLSKAAKQDWDEVGIADGKDSKKRIVAPFLITSNEYYNIEESVRPAARPPTKAPTCAVKIRRPKVRPGKSSSPDPTRPQPIVSLSIDKSLMTEKPPKTRNWVGMGDWFTPSSVQPSIKTTPSRECKLHILSPSSPSHLNNPSSLALESSSSEFKVAVGIAAWRALPARLAFEDKVAARAADRKVRDPHVKTPAIKETYRRVVISADTLSRTIVAQSVNFIE